MKTKQETYAGNNLFKVEFGLYQFDDIDFVESKRDILSAFKTEFEQSLKKTLKSIGLKYIGLSYFSPREYNFTNDSVDLTIEVTDKNRFRAEILKHEKEIKTELEQNKSYDGYMALTVSDVAEELDKLEKDNYSPDIIELGVILRKYIDFKDFDMNEHLCFEEEEDNEKGTDR